MAHPAPVLTSLVLPGWLTRAIIGTGTTLLLTGAAALAVKAIRIELEHETRISVLEDHQKGIDESLNELKADTKEILKRMPRR